jgi:hypothetical protein
MKNVISIDQKTEIDFINLSRDLIQMTSDEKVKFLCSQDGIPLREKVQVIETFIMILEKIEDYETCAGLFKLRSELLAA